MLFSALLTSTGQLCWTLSSGTEFIFWIVAGFALYGVGALVMIFALHFGELSILHPMLGIGYVLSILLGYFVLGEPMHLTKLAGIAMVIAGLILISGEGRKTL